MNAKRILAATFVTVMTLMSEGTSGAQPAGAPPQAPPKLPIPDAPVIVLIEDVPAFEKALQGGIRKMLSGDIPAGDPAAAAWRRTRIGGKLSAQWELLGEDLPLTWREISSLKPSALGLALLSAGDLEAVLVIRTPLAQLPVKLKTGTQKNHKGIVYQLVTRGAGDDRLLDRRMGLAWARNGGHLFLATSERALVKALDQSLSGGGYTGLTEGFAQLRLDIDSLRKDLYFRREFLFDEGIKGKEQGILLAGLRIEGGDLVEVRQGTGENRGGAANWPVKGRVRAAGWEPDAWRLFPALRRAILEPVTAPLEKPVPGLKPIPGTLTSGEDHYLVDVTRPISISPDASGEGELPEWNQFLGPVAARGWGWELTMDGYPRLVMKVTKDEEKRFLELCRLTLTRKTGAAPSEEPGTMSTGPRLPVIAYRRKGDWLWVGQRPEDLASVPDPQAPAGLVRWGYADVSDVSFEKKMWAQAEGVFSTEETRPFSDRILGLIAWTPSLRSVSSERMKNGDRFTEKVVFTRATEQPPAPKAPPPAKAPPKKKV